MAAGRQRRSQRPQDLLGAVGVRDEVQHRHDHHRDRLCEVQQPGDLRVGQDRLRVAQVLLEHRGALVAGQDLLAVRHRHRVHVDVDDARLPVDPLGDLVHVADGGDAGADVEELADAGLGEVLHGPAQERAVGLGHQWRLRHRLHHRAGGRPIGGEVVRAAEVVVVHAGDAGAFDVDRLGCPVRPLHVLPLGCRRRAVVTAARITRVFCPSAVVVQRPSSLCVRPFTVRGQPHPRRRRGPRPRWTGPLPAVCLRTWARPVPRAGPAAARSSAPGPGWRRPASRRAWRCGSWRSTR